MKTTILFFLLIALTFSDGIFAQKTVQKITKVKSISGATYVLEQTGGSERAYIKNKNGVYDQLMKERGKDCEQVGTRDENALHQSINEIVKSIFSVTRIKQLSDDLNNNFFVICISNPAGEIKAVSFLNVSSSITLYEIKALENAFMKLKLNLIVGCPETKYIKYNFYIKFGKFL